MVVDPKIVPFHECKLYRRLCWQFYILTHHFVSIGECLSFEDFVAEIHADTISEDGVYFAQNCSGIGHRDTCTLTCGIGFEWSNAIQGGTFICDPDIAPFPGWRREDNTVSTSSDALCSPGTMSNARSRDIDFPTRFKLTVFR